MKTKLSTISLVATSIITIIIGVLAFIDWYEPGDFSWLSFKRSFFVFLICVFVLLLIILFTIRKNMEQKKILRVIINAQEKERDHIGRELHDNINQLLVTTKLYLRMAGSRDEATKEANAYPMELIDSSIEEIRLLCHKLVTPLKDIHLDELVRKLLITLDANSTTKTEFVYSVSTKFLSNDLKLNIYRIIQEQINNISKYADAKHVNISIREQNKAINIFISDDGKGFDVSSKRKGIGISNMLSRIESFNGKMQIDSSLGNGCRTMISMPC